MNITHSTLCKIVAWASTEHKNTFNIGELLELMIEKAEEKHVSIRQTPRRNVGYRTEAQCYLSAKPLHATAGMFCIQNRSFNFLILPRRLWSSFYS